MIRIISNKQIFTIAGKLLLFFVIFVLIVSCTSKTLTGKEEIEVISSPTTNSLNHGKGGIIGKIMIPDKWLDHDLYIFASPYLGDPQSEGIFILSTQFIEFGNIYHNGYFQISNLTPGFFVLVIGPTIDEADAYRINGVAVKIEVIANEYSDVGQISIGQ